MIACKSFRDSLALGAVAVLAACNASGGNQSVVGPAPYAQSGYSVANVATRDSGAGAQINGSFEALAAAPVSDIAADAFSQRFTETRATQNVTAPLVFQQANFPGGPIIEGSNTARGTGVLGTTGSPGGYGVFGLVANTAPSGAGMGVYGAATGPGSIGVYGVAATGASQPGFGVYGLSNNGAGVIGLTHGTNAAAGFFQSSSGSPSVALQALAPGNAIVGESSLLNGVLGTTTFASGVTGNGSAGLLGQDLSKDQGTGDSGVAGTSASGYGVSGTTSAEGTGVGGFSTSGVGVFGSSNTNLGLFGTSNIIAAEGSSNAGIGVVAETAAAPDGTAPAGVNGPPALLVSTDGGSPAIKAVGNNGDILSLDANGNLIVSGNLTIDGNLSVAGSTGACPSCPQPLDRARAGTSPAANSGATFETMGSGRIVAGRGFVKLDPAFTNQLKAQKSYLVFITPQGDNRGLFVTKEVNGFAVQESQGGRSSLAFDYRVVGSVTAAGAASRSPLHTPTSVLQLARHPFRRAPVVPHYHSGLVPRQPVLPQQRSQP